MAGGGGGLAASVGTAARAFQALKRALKNTQKSSINAGLRALYRV